MTLNLQTPFPTFGGSTGGWLRAAEVEEKYAITWTSSKEQIFEMPTGGAAIMRNGENLLYLARKEQCLALGTQLRTFKINNYKIYRIFPSGEVQYLRLSPSPPRSQQGRIQSQMLHQMVARAQ
jgi:photosystem I subunit 2